MSVSHMTLAVTAEPVDAAIVLEKVEKTYGSQKVLGNVSFHVKHGEIFSLLGPNGAGKTTLMKIITGLSKPSGGRVKILGHDSFLEKNTVKSLIAFVPQNNNLERELTVEQALRVYGKIYCVQDLKCRLEEVVAEFKLENFFKKKVEHLSGGMARRVLIARALLARPQVLLLDEPTVGLDPDIRREIWNIIGNLAKQGRTVFFTTHYMDEAEKLSNRVALLRQGKLIDVDTTENIITKVKIPAGQEASLETAFIELLGGDKT